jgi:hypothetical protein
MGLLATPVGLPGLEERCIDFGLSGEVAIVLDDRAGAGGCSRQFTLCGGLSKTRSIKDVDVELA